MDTRYETLLDELHVNKRELTNYRQKYLNIESKTSFLLRLASCSPVKSSRLEKITFDCSITQSKTHRTK